MNKWTTKNGTEIIQLLSGRSNVFLVKKGFDCLLIDTSVTRRFADLNEKLQAFCSGTNKLRALVLTHGHFDHVENWAVLIKEYGMSVIAQEWEVPFLEKGRYPLPKGTILPTKLMLGLFKGIAENMGGFSPVKCSISVKNRYELKELGIAGYIIHTPGHTKGCISVVIDNEVAIVGDGMFGVRKNSIFPPFADDVPEMIRSWKRLLDAGCKWYLPSHGTANPRELVQSEYEKYKDKV